MYIFMNEQAHKYAAKEAKNPSDCLIPFHSSIMQDVLEAAAPEALSDEIMNDMINDLKNSPKEDQDEFYAKLQEKRDAYPQPQQ